MARYLIKVFLQLDENAIGLANACVWVCVSVHVAEALDRDDPGYLEALQQETIILEKRVEMCQSRIMLVTCFDINV